jgi:glycosyltransferase involved in cell wall biosynthesis
VTVSVVIPCYNAGRFIGEAIESTLFQSRPPAEVIVVDDASTDNSVHVAESFGDRVRVIRCAHAGVAATRNAGVAVACGDLIASLDADDVWERGKLECQVPRFDDPAVGLVYGQARHFGAGLTSNAPWPPEPPEGDLFERLYLDRNFIACSSVLVRRHALVEAGGFDGNVAPAEDLDAWLRVALKWKIAAVRQVVCGYRRHADQASSQRAGVVRSGLRVREKLASEFERRTGMSSGERRQQLARLFLGELKDMIDRRKLAEARALAAVLEVAFGSDMPEVRRAIARQRRTAGLLAPAFWIRDFMRRSIGS